ncbi:hypothetical protein SteCoe_10077 [Stentor coeruleus]|uniref:Uncharacterized protein n=1 Tax=Stentor coeruleus TaxID=5963 RepID=A0A1R2CGD7_9CILI|nr:hypothetical protein SteCoe_10077 [Stentor coeruleus]
MEQHDFVAGPNGLCEKCGKTRKECTSINEVYATGLAETPGLHVNKAIVFFEQIPENCTVQQIACSKYNSFILSTAGKIYSWGETTNALGRILEKRDDAKFPKLIFDLRNKFIVQICCGETHVLALDFEKTTYSWGFNKFGQLGHGDLIDRNVPTKIEALKSIVKISAAANFSYSVSENGRVYAWGDNKNFQLGQIADDQGLKQSKFLSPRLIENCPWDKSVDIEVVGGNTSNYFYRSQNAKNASDGINSLEAKRLQLENEELKRKVEFLKKKVAILEEELYKNNPDMNPLYGVNQDTALQEMQALLRNNIEAALDIEKNIKDYDIEILKLTKEVQELETVISELDSKEANYWDEIESKDNDLIQLHSKKTRDLGKIEEIKNKKDTIQDYIKTIENTRNTYYSELTVKQDLLEDANKSKSSLELELIDSQKKEMLYKQMISSREKEIQRVYFDKKQENVEHDIISLLKIHEALKEASLENIAKSLSSSSIKDYIKMSNDLLERILGETGNLRFEAKKSPLKNMHNLWDVLEENIKLRKTINDYTEGLIFQTSSQLAVYFDQYEDDETKGLFFSAYDYAKKVLKIGGLKVKEEDYRIFRRPKENNIIAKRSEQRRKWRFC